MVLPSHVRHAVQVYETDGFLAQRVVDFLHGGLSGNQRCVVVATAPHRALFMAGLEDRGVDIKAAVTAGDLIVLDAQDTLDSFMIGDRPEPARFHATVGLVLARATRDGRKVRAFGEMVDVLWRDGKPDAALSLERMWNSLAEVHRFELLCAYTIANLFKTAAGRYQEICEVHDHAHEPEPTEDNVRVLLAEIGRRANVERELREQIRTLQRSEEAERLRATRLAKLQHATATLADAISLGELSDKILNTANKLVGSVAGVVYLVDTEGRYRLCGSQNVPGVGKWKILPADAPLPLAHAMTTGRALWLEKRERLLQMFEGMTEATLDKSRTHAAIALPLVHGGRVIGGIALSFETQRSFPDDERAWIESFAAQCATAVERVRHYVAEHKARSEAENLLRIAESLNDMHLDLEAILQRVTDEATALVGAQFGAFFYNVEDDKGDSYMLYTLSGARKEQFSKLGMPRNTAIFAHTFNGLGVVRLDDVKQDPRYGKMAPHHGMPQGHLPVTSYLAVPVKSRTGKVIGGLFFGHEEAARFTAQHESTLRALAVTAAIAIDNAELYASARAAEDAQRKSVDQLVDTVRMNELFTAVLAHDLRSPLAAVSTAGELLQLKVGDAEGRIVDRILGSTRRMTRMIEQLLDFTRIRVGTGLPLDTKAVDLSTMLPHVIDELRVRHPNTAFAFDAIGNATGRWDDDRLAQAFSNLIGNAAQHGIPDHGVVVIIDGNDPDVVRVSVQNAGVIPPALVPQMFEPMIGGQRRRDGTRGLGIGLYITREIALAHGGSITVDSNEADGTTFTLTLPREVASIEARPREPEPAKQATQLDLAQRMRAIVEGVRDHAIFSLDQDAKVESWSPAAERITGWSRDDVASKSIEMLYPPEDRSMLELELGRANKLGSSKHEGWYVRPDGTRYWADVSISALRSASGDLVGYAVVIRDLTEHRQRIAKLEENDARARLMIDSVRDYAIFMLDADGNVASWNRGAQLTKGYTPGEIIGRSHAEFYTREDRAAGKPQQMLERATRDGRLEDEGWRVRKDGSRFWADVVITALRDDNNACLASGTLGGVQR